jgi:hypothetical protein
MREHASPAAPSPRNRRRACSLRSQGRLPTSLPRETLDAGGMLMAAVDEGCAGTGPAISQVHCSTLEYVGDAPALNEAAMRARGCHPAYASRIQPRTADPTPDLPGPRSSGNLEIHLASAFARQPDGIRLVAPADPGGIVRRALELQLDRPPKLTIDSASEASAPHVPHGFRCTAVDWPTVGRAAGRSKPQPASPRGAEGSGNDRLSPQPSRRPSGGYPAARSPPGRRAGIPQTMSPERRPGSPLGHHPSNS